LSSSVCPYLPHPTWPFLLCWPYDPA
jgi:hypothetical protein